MRTIPDISNLFKRVDEIILTEFIPAITGGITITESERKLLSLAPKLGGMGIPILEEECKIEYQNSIMISEYLCNRSTRQYRKYEQDPEIDKKKNENKIEEIGTTEKDSE